MCGDMQEAEALERELRRLCRFLDEPEVGVDAAATAAVGRPGNSKVFDAIRAVVAERASDRPTARALLGAYREVRDPHRRDVRWRDAAALSAAAALEMVGCTVDAVDRVVASKGEAGGAPSVDVLSDEATTMLAASCAVIRAVRALLRIDPSLAAHALAELAHRPPMLGRVLPRASIDPTVVDHRVRPAVSCAVTGLAARIGRGIGALGTGRTIAFQLKP